MPQEGVEAVNNSTPKSLTETFYEHLPFYLSIGMPPEQYWDGDCRLVKCYRKANDLKRQNRNQELWLQGAYFYEALLDVAPILHALAKDGTKPIPYVSQPFPITAKEIAEAKRQKEKEAFEAMKARFAARAASINAQKAKKEVEQDG